MILPTDQPQPFPPKPKGESAQGRLFRQIEAAGAAGITEADADVPWVNAGTFKKLFLALHKRRLIYRDLSGRWIACPKKGGKS